MSKHFFIAGLLLLVGVCGYGQKKTGVGDVVFEREMPYGWGESVAAVITVKDAKGMEVKNSDVVIKCSKAVAVDIRSLAPGRYTMKVTTKNSDLKPNEFERDFEKKQGSNRLVLKFKGRESPGRKPIADEKPVIYLYPEQMQDVAVKVHLQGELTITIPDYKDGWKVSATPDGLITNYADGKQYPYLFWEGISYMQDWPMEHGSVVSADSSRAFLERVLPAMGLVAKEYNEFIEYWLPKMQQNEYNLIHFAGADYDAMAPLEITPRPDAVLRVFMVFKAADKDTKAVPQRFDGFVRKGFTVVEWGGAQLDGMKTAGR